MKIRMLSALLLSIALIWGCVEKETDVTSKPELVVLDTLHTFMDFDSHGISRPGDLTFLPNGNLAVADGQIKNITFVTPGGENVAQFGKEGRGPAEFIRPSQLFAHSEKLSVSDPSQNKVLEFNFSGDYLDNYGYETSAIGGHIALNKGRTFFTGAAGQEGHLVQWYDASNDSSFLFGKSKGSEVEDMNMDESRKDIVNGRIPDYFKNNVRLFSANDHVYVFLDSYSELRKYDREGSLIWDTALDLPDNEKLKEDIIEAAKNMPNALPFLRYSVAIKEFGGDIYVLGGKARNAPQHITRVSPDGDILAFYQMPDPDIYAMSFAINPENQNIYLSDMRSGTVLKGNLENE